MLKKKSKVIDFILTRGANPKEFLILSLLITLLPKTIINLFPAIISQRKVHVGHVHCIFNMFIIQNKYWATRNNNKNVLQKSKCNLHVCKYEAYQSSTCVRA